MLGRVRDLYFPIYESLFGQVPRDLGQEDFRDRLRPRRCQRGTGYRRGGTKAGPRCGASFHPTQSPHHPRGHAPKKNCLLLGVRRIVEQHRQLDAAVPKLREIGNITISRVEVRRSIIRRKQDQRL
jgi:hypothetical protein